VQSGGSGGLERYAEAVLRRGRQQGFWHLRHAGGPNAALGEEARRISVSYFLGTDGRVAVHGMDRSLRRGNPAGGTARPDSRVPATPRLRPAALRTQRLRPETPGG